MKKIKIRVQHHSGKKFYVENYPDVWACRNSSKKDAFKRYLKKFPTASITDYYERHDFEKLEWYIPVDDYYTTSVWGYVHLPSKTSYKQLIKLGKIKLF